jgi:hypothetical protein
MFAVGEGGDAYMVEAPGNNTSPGILHRVQADGTVDMDLNTNLAIGGNQIIRDGQGRMLVMGTSLVGMQTTRVMEISASDGKAKGNLFDGPTSFYASGLAVDDFGAVYFADSCCDDPFYKVTGSDTFVEWGTGKGNNTRAHFGSNGTTLWIISATAFGKLEQGFSFADGPSSDFPMRWHGIDVGNDGSIYLLQSCGMSDPGCGTGQFEIVRTDANGLNPEVLIADDVEIHEMSLDTATGDLLLYAHTDGTICDAGTFGEMYRFTVE